MRISANPSAIARTRWYEFAVRFLFGGAITVIAGLIAKRFGPIMGGLFLAFPAIFPASATLIEKHESEKKRKAGILHTIRGRQAAAVDAEGAALGSVGLLCFALFVWKVLIANDAALVLLGATAVWLGASFGCWYIRKAHRWHPWH